MFDKQFLKRFWSKVRKSSPNCCWLWIASKDRRGYGRFHYDNTKIEFAHRVAWMIERNALVPAKKEIMHSCDNPTCVNPGHLSVGTHLQNVRDMMKKGRHRVVINPKKGQDCSWAKLSDNDVREIRASKLTQQKLADRFGVSPNQICRIKLRKAWKHI